MVTASFLFLINWAALLPLAVLRFAILSRLVLDIRSPRDTGASDAAPAPPLRRTALASSRDLGPARPDPLPRPADLAVPTLPLTRPDVAVLLHNSAHALPDAVALRKTMNRPKHVVAQVRKEKESVVASVVEGQFLLVGEAIQHLVDKAGDLSVEGTTGDELLPRVQNGSDEAD